MPDIRRERQLRESYNFDLPVVFQIDTGGTRDSFGRYTPAFINFTAWGRRQDTSSGAGYYFDTGGAFRLTGDIGLFVRYDPRITAGALNTFQVSGEGFVIASTELIGRGRYMLIQGSHGAAP